MATINFKPTWITEWENLNSEYIPRRTSEPFRIASNQYDGYNYSAELGFDYNELINVIERSQSSTVVFFGVNVINNPARWIQVTYHDRVEQNLDEAASSHPTGNEMDLTLGENVINITNNEWLSTNFTFLEALRDRGHRGIRIYKSGFGSTPGIVEVDNTQIIIEGDWEIGNPTIRSLSGGISHNVDDPAVFEWTHNGSFDQTEFDLRYRPVGSTSWTEITEISSSQSYTLPAGDLSLGEYEWQVRTRTDYGYESAWSSLSVFQVAETTPTPTIIQPELGGTVPISDLHVEWESEEQYEFELELVRVIGDSQSTELIRNVSRTSTSTEHTFEDVLDNNETYIVRLRVNEEGGIWSSWATTFFDVEYTEPAQPELVFVTDNNKSTITVYIENPTPTGTQPDVLYQDLYRVEDGKAILLARNLDPNDFYVDYTPASGKEYAYYVRIYGENEVNVNSDHFYASVKVKKTLISIANKPDELIRLEIVRSRSTGKNYNSTTRNFSGRKLPVTEFGETLEGSIDIQCLVKPSEFDMLNNLIDRNETLLYRDSRGRKKYVTISEISIADEYKKFFSVELPMVEVDYNEAIE